jgi:hypothetical protein
MEAQYHIQLLTETLGSHFSLPALQEIIAANLGQDALRYQLGAYPHYHFDGNADGNAGDNAIARGQAYVDEEQALIGKLAATPTATSAVAAEQRAALGRLTHAAHDFYAHSNYVDLWLDAHGGLGGSTPQAIAALEPSLLNHPDLHSGSFLLWFDTLYYIPGLRPLLRKIYLRPKSHEVMNLDTPGQGPKFYYAMAAAKERTHHEYQRAAAAIRAQGGEPALQRFHGG